MKLVLGDRGNDVISGNGGNDQMKGTESSNLGRGEIDVLIGGPGVDIFVLDNFYDLVLIGWDWWQHCLNPDINSRKLQR